MNASINVGRSAYLFVSLRHRGAGVRAAAAPDYRRATLGLTDTLASMIQGGRGGQH